jgi:hypothetical protein
MDLFSLEMQTDFSIYREKKGRYNVIRSERRGLTWPYTPHGRLNPAARRGPLAIRTIGDPQ